MIKEYELTFAEGITDLGSYVKEYHDKIEINATVKLPYYIVNNYVNTDYGLTVFTCKVPESLKNKTFVYDCELSGFDYGYSVLYSFNIVMGDEDELKFNNAAYNSPISQYFYTLNFYTIIPKK